ncbi:MAG: EAL domain-containing protein [Methylotenera sp.]|nr:EAL domain-containing protein [Methylotenera sp.]MDP2403040.1 EAL domain-containing protein [Methylotenera sp.]MDP3096083.1 EAL domain-containing protein [Methylotenera sp.]MDZ4222998.1 EAL domain-containing protein [Methylotenera sp.]
MSDTTSSKGRARWLLIVFVAVMLTVSSVAWMSIGAGKAVSQQAEELAEQRIPELREIAELQSAMSDRVTQLYLSYSTGERLVLQTQYTERAERVHLHVDALSRLNLMPEKRQEFLAMVQAFDLQAHRFDQEMAKGADRSWDMLREHLAGAQSVIDQMTVMLAMWRDEISVTAQKSGESALSEVGRLTKLQLGFSIAVLLVSAFVLIALYARLKDQDELYRRAYFDGVTGLPNRWKLEQQLQIKLDQHGTGCLQILRIDRLKIVASTYGHETADQLIQTTARWLQTRLASHNIPHGLYRLNSDSLAILCEQNAARADAERLAQDLASISNRPFELGERELRIALDIGIALFPGDGESVSCLVRNADAALNAKSNGIHYRFFEKRMTDDSAFWLSTEGLLRSALEKQEFELHYQPKQSTDGSTTKGSEALIRWRQGDKLVSPALFIPVAEDSGLILPIGTWVLYEACRQWRAWADSGLPFLPIAVNVSAQQFQDEAFPALVADALQQYAIPQGMIELEITEAVAADHPERVIATMQQLKQAGVSLAIDDFGTGYSSLSYLQRFPIDTLKIDQAFVRTMGSSPEDAAIVSLIMSLAKSLRLKVVAEGVETTEQQEQLSALDCDLLQGYLFSKPIPATEFALRLQSTQSASQ